MPVTLQSLLPGKNRSHAGKYDTSAVKIGGCKWSCTHNALGKNERAKDFSQLRTMDPSWNFQAKALTWRFGSEARIKRSPSPLRLSQSTRSSRSKHVKEAVAIKPVSESAADLSCRPVRSGNCAASAARPASMSALQCSRLRWRSAGSRGSSVPARNMVHRF